MAAVFCLYVPSQLLFCSLKLISHVCFFCLFFVVVFYSKCTVQSESLLKGDLKVLARVKCRQRCFFYQGNGGLEEVRLGVGFPVRI